MSHDSLENHFMTNFNLTQNHGWSFGDIDSMLPWERSIYVELLSQKIRNEAQIDFDRAVANKRR